MVLSCAHQLGPTSLTDNKPLGTQVSEMEESKDRDQRITWFILKTDWDKAM